MAARSQQTTVYLCAAPHLELLRDLVMPVLESRLASLSADPLIATESRQPGTMPATATGWLERVVSRTGHSATTIDLTNDFILACGDPAPKIAVTQLGLDPDPAQVDQLYAIGIWSRFITRKRRWSMRVSPRLMAEIVANAACADPILTVQLARWRTLRFAVISGDLIAAEVTGRALRSVLQPAGDIGQTPWQSAIVQAASERGLGIAHGGDMSIRVDWAGPDSYPDWHAFRSQLVRVAHLIDCQLMDSTGQSGN